MKRVNLLSYLLLGLCFFSLPVIAMENQDVKLSDVKLEDYFEIFPNCETENEEKTVYVCKKCEGKMFYSIDDAQRHINFHLPQNNIGFVFNNQPVVDINMQQQNQSPFFLNCNGIERQGINSEQNNLLQGQSVVLDVVDNISKPLDKHKDRKTGDILITNLLSEFKGKGKKSAGDIFLAFFKCHGYIRDENGKFKCLECGTLTKNIKSINEHFVLDHGVIAVINKEKKNIKLLVSWDKKVKNGESKNILIENGFMDKNYRCLYEKCDNKVLDANYSKKHFVHSHRADINKKMSEQKCDIPELKFNRKRKLENKVENNGGSVNQQSVNTVNSLIPVIVARDLVVNNMNFEQQQAPVINNLFNTSTISLKDFEVRHPSCNQPDDLKRRKLEQEFVDKKK